MDVNKIYNEDCLEGMKRIPDASIDCILTDPPYLYLKGQKLDRPFDEHALFTEFKRVLKPTGFVVLFGRGTSFYRWNTMLAELGFVFKEEIIWDKGHNTSPLMRLSRVHETISLHTMGGTINKVKIPYIEMKQYDMGSVIQDIKRLRSVFTQAKSMEAVKLFLENNCNDTSDRGGSIIRADRTDNEKFTKFGVNSDKRKTGDRCCNVMQSMEFGLNEKSIIKVNRTGDDKTSKHGIITGKFKTVDRCCSVVQSMEFGLSEKSIIKCTRDHYAAIHPTQKPVRLLERLLALTTHPGDIVLDPFMGSFSTAIACVNTNRDFIGFEIDEDYYDIGMKRLNEAFYESKLAITNNK